DVLRLNEDLLTAIAKAFDGGSVADAWFAYTTQLGIRHDTYMRTDMEGASMQRLAAGNEPAGERRPGGERRRGGKRGRPGDPDPANGRRAGSGREPGSGGRDGGPAAEAGPGGYEGVALRVIEGLTARKPGTAIVNTRNGASLGFLDPDDVVEVPALIHGGGVAPLAAGALPRSARGLVTQVKEYEREVVGAAASGDAERAALALALHPLVPGISVAREMMSEYRERHGRHLAYLR
ncbi:MAG TPA: hypothetical protein VIV12_01305, partial [Streptosporangiaceae bacterium]